jgi:outer membrane murein-binding lipoprotein Lpp
MTFAAILKIIDAALDIKAVQYLLLVLVIALLVVSGFNIARQKVLSLQLSAANGDKAQYASALLTQNAAIKKQGDDMQQMQKQIQEANSKAADMKAALKKRMTQINEVVLTGDCPQMVQQVIDEVRK